jgi:hypothetical protein
VLLGPGGRAATFVALAPSLPPRAAEPIDVAFRVVGASFAACGLAPGGSSRQPQRPAHDRHRVRPVRHAAAGAGRRPAAQTLLLLPRVLFFVPLVLTLLTGGRLRTPMDRVLVAAVLLDLVVLAPLWLMFAPEDGNLLLIVDDPRVAGLVDSMQLSLFVAVLIGASLVLGARWWAASAPGRRALLPGVAGATCLLLFAALIAVQLTTGVKSPVLLWIATCSLITVPVAFLAGLLRSRLARSGVADLFRDLRSIGPVELETTLARVLGDPQLLLAFPDGEGLGRRGHPVQLPAAEAGRASPRSTRRRGVAVLIYDRSLEDDPGNRRDGGRKGAGEPPAAREITARLAELQAPASASSPRPTPSAAARTTCTTAPSSGWSRSPCSSTDSARDPSRPGGGRAARELRARNGAFERAARARPHPSGRSGTASTSPWTRSPSAQRTHDRPRRGRPAAARAGEFAAFRGVGGTGQRSQARAGLGGRDPLARRWRRRRHDHRRRRGADPTRAQAAGPRRPRGRPRRAARSEHARRGGTRSPRRCRCAPTPDPTG